MDDFGYHTILDVTGVDARLLKDAQALHNFFSARCSARVSLY